MKKILFTTLALLTIVLTATAQETREKVSRNRISAQISFAQKFMLIKLDKKKRDFAADAAKLYSGLSFHVATAT